MTPEEKVEEALNVLINDAYPFVKDTGKYTYIRGVERGIDRPRVFRIVIEEAA